MIFSSTLVTLFLAGLSQAVPAPLQNITFIPPTTHTQVAPPIQSTSIPQNGTGKVSFTTSNFTDVTPHIDPNVTLSTFIKPEIFIPPIFPIKFKTCQTLIDAKGTQLAANVGTPTSGFITDSNWGTVHKNYLWGAIYCHDVASGAHAVYGQIWQKWVPQNGAYGYPITDETGTTDNIGTTIRFNIFSQKNAIYWTGARGAFLIYGDIYQRWLSIGDVKSVVGYPITDETGSGTYGGRYNDFTNGMIYWHAGTSWVHTGGLPSWLSWTWNPIGGLTDVTGSVTVTISSNGNAHWVSNIHDDIIVPMNWQVGWILLNADGTAITLTKSGSCGPNLSGIPIFGGPVNDNNIDATSNNPVISQNWRAFVAWNWGRASAQTSIDWSDMLNGLLADAKAVEPYIAAVVAVLA